MERLSDDQRGGMWSPEKFSQIGNNVSFKHAQKQILSSPFRFVIGPPYTGALIVWGKNVFLLPPLPFVFSYLDTDRRDNTALLKFWFNSPK